MFSCHFMSLFLMMPLSLPSHLSANHISPLTFLNLQFITFVCPLYKHCGHAPLALISHTFRLGALSPKLPLSFFVIWNIRNFSCMLLMFFHHRLSMSSTPSLRLLPTLLTDQSLLAVIKSIMNVNAVSSLPT